MVMSVLDQTFGLEPVELVLNVGQVERRILVDAHRAVHDRRRGLFKRAVRIDIFMDQLDHRRRAVFTFRVIDKGGVEVIGALGEGGKEALHEVWLVLGILGRSEDRRDLIIRDIVGDHADLHDLGAGGDCLGDMRYDGPAVDLAGFQRADDRADLLQRLTSFMSAREKPSFSAILDAM